MRVYTVGNVYKRMMVSHTVITTHFGGNVMEKAQRWDHHYDVLRLLRTAIKFLRASRLLISACRIGSGILNLRKCRFSMCTREGQGKD